MYLKRVALTILLLLAIYQIARSQEYKPQTFYQLSHRRGENKPHRTNIKNLTYPYRTIDFKLGWQTQGADPWHEAFRYPRLGIGANYASFNTDIIGDPMAIYFFVQFPQIRYKHFNFDIEFDLGPSYGINPWDPITNPSNQSTGTKLNAFFSMYFQQSLNILKYWNVFVGEGLSHYSNATLGTPNAGLNAFSLEFGLRYCPKQLSFNRNTVPDGNKKWYMSNYLAAGVRRPSDTGQKLPVYNWIVYQPQLLKRVSHKRRVGFGAEIAFNENYKSGNRDYTIDEKLVATVAVIHEFILKKFAITSQLGVHVLHPYGWSQPIYERIGFGYYLTKKVRVNLNLRAVGNKADYLEFGINYEFPLN